MDFNGPLRILVDDAKMRAIEIVRGGSTVGFMDAGNGQGSRGAGGGMGALVRKAGWYWMPYGGGSTGTSSTLTNTSCKGIPIVVPSRLTVAAMGAEVTSAGDVGSKLRLAVAAADPDRDLPTGATLIEGTIAGDSGTVQEFAVSPNVVLDPGFYWVLATVQLAPSVQPTVRTGGSVVSSGIFSAQPGANGLSGGIALAGVAGAYPTFAPATDAWARESITFQPRVFFKLA